MVGDRFHDVAGALECGIQCIGAAYGYGGEAELRKAGAVYLARSVEELKILSDRYRNHPTQEPSRKKRRPYRRDRCKNMAGALSYRHPLRHLLCCGSGGGDSPV